LISATGFVRRRTTAPSPKTHQATIRIGSRFISLASLVGMPSSSSMSATINKAVDRYATSRPRSSYNNLPKNLALQALEVTEYCNRVAQIDTVTSMNSFAQACWAQTERPLATSLSRIRGRRRACRRARHRERCDWRQPENYGVESVGDSIQSLG